VDIGFHHRGVDTHLAARNDLVLPRDLHHALRHLADRLRPQLPAEGAHGLVVGNLPAANTRELAIHQVGAHFPLQVRIAPVADVLEQHQPQRHFRRGQGPAASCFTLAAASAEGLLHDLQKLPVVDGPIGMEHPGLPQIAHFLGDEAVGEGALQAAKPDHALLRGGRAALWDRAQRRLNCSRLRAAI